MAGSFRNRCSRHLKFELWKFCYFHLRARASKIGHEAAMIRDPALPEKNFRIVGSVQILDRDDHRTTVQTVSRPVLLMSPKLC